MDYKLRPSTENDYKFCYDLTKKNMHDLFSRHWGGWVDSEFRKGYVTENIQIIMVGSKTAGYFSHKTKGKSVYIDNIQILSSLHGKGLGTLVLRAFLNEHSDLTIRLTTFQDNPAKRLYGRFGFEVVEKNGFTIKMEKIAQQGAAEDAENPHR